MVVDLQMALVLASRNSECIEGYVFFFFFYLPISLDGWAFSLDRVLLKVFE